MPRTPTAPSGHSRVPPGSTKLLIVAAVMAVVAVVLVNMYVLAATRSVKQNEFPVFRLKVAKSPGQRLQASDVTLVAMPESWRDAFSDAIGANDAGQPLRLGDTFTRPAKAQDFLREQHFDIASDDDTRLLINKNKRGIALPVDSKTLPEPLKPEMFVDLEAPFRGPGGTIEVLPVMERVRVVSVGNTSIVEEKSGRGGRAAGTSKLTVEVTPEQATQLEAIGTITAGNFRVHLRSTDDLGRPNIVEDRINPEVLARLGQAGVGF